MTLRGKRDGFALNDFKACAKLVSMKRGRSETIVGEVTAAVERWTEFAKTAGVPVTWRKQVQASHRLSLAG